METSKNSVLPRFSIIIPFKKGREYLKKSVESVRNQSCKDFELVVLADNESNIDGAIDWVISLSDPAIRLVQSSGSLNINQNWKRIEEVARGEYLTILGYDDILFPNYLEAIEELISKHPRAGLYFTHFNFIDFAGEKFGSSPLMKSEIDGPDFLKRILNSEYFIMATGYMMRTADYIKVGGIPLQYPNLLYADFELWIRLTSLSYLAVSPLITFSFRIHQSTTKVTNASHMLHSFELLIEYLVSIEGDSMQRVLNSKVGPFLVSHCNEICYRVIRSPVKNPDRIRVKHIIERFNMLTIRLNITTINYLSQINIKLAYLIDSHWLCRRIYFIGRKVFKKSLLKFKQ